MRSSIKIKILVLFLLLVAVPAIAGAQPERIVSLAPSVTESLLSLGLENELIAVTSHCDLPAGTAQKEIIGDLTNSNVEKIYSLSPDMVLAVRGTNSMRKVERLKSLGLNVVVFEESRNLEEILENYILLGRLTGREEEAVKTAKSVREKVDSIRDKVKGMERVKVFWEVGAKPLIGAGPESFVNDFILYAGGINIFADTGKKYMRVSREEVLRRNPDVILLITMGDVSQAEASYWKKFKDLNAAASGRIYVVEADKVCRPTPLSFLAGLELVAPLIHPEAFKKKGPF